MIRNNLETIKAPDIDPVELWIIEIADSCDPKQARKTRTPWLSEEAIEIANKRRERKQADAESAEIRKLNSLFQCQARKD